MSSSLFSTFRLADLALDNRLVIAPMCQYSAADGCVTDWHMTHLGTLANSGAALLVVEATGVERRGRITHGCVGLYSDDCEAALQRVVAHCRRIGTAKLGIQLAHAGRKASSQRPWEGGLGLKPGEDPWETIGPSAIACGADWPAPREMNEADMERVKEAFVAAALRALRIGFDAIELHLAHGYLLHSFVSPISNKRSDRYGGSLDNRMRFPRAVAQAVRAVVPRSVPLGARVSAQDWLDGGLTIDDTVILSQALKSDGLDFICASSGGLTAEARNPTTPGYNIAFAERIGREAKIATRAVGLIATPQQAEAVIANGQADQVALGRAFLDDPHWAWRAARALGADIRRPVQYLRAAPKMWPGATY
jgi:2,4-dienoyl-CoA reductase-like NADH-dependent reductase (Old Yellow Enzyme family)